MSLNINSNVCPAKSHRYLSESLAQYYRCPNRWLHFEVQGDIPQTRGYFRCGKAVCYGESSLASRSSFPAPDDVDALRYATVDRGTLQLPFIVDQAMDALRLELYASSHRLSTRPMLDSAITKAYYVLRPLLPVAIRKHLQKIKLNDWKKIAFPSWPVDCNVDVLARQLLLQVLRASGLRRIPFIWFWPGGATSCAIMTHDVETAAGRDYCPALMDINDSFGIKSSFQVVPEVRYEVTREYLSSIQTRGFEVNVQDLNHDGRLYRDRKQFLERVKKINSYGAAWGAAGFRAAVLYRNEQWFDQLKFEYDMSVPNVGHLDPQRGGCCTVMPYFIGDILEVPVTTTQDYSLFHILKDYTLTLWKRQLQLIADNHGLASFIIHPDYVIGKRENALYRELLEYLAVLRDTKNVWFPKPGELNRWWRERGQMWLVEDGGKWRIKGEGQERARIAFASEDNGELEFELESV
jgi:hypothetical protein